MENQLNMGSDSSVPPPQRSVPDGGSRQSAILSRGNLLLVALFVAAAGGLYLLHLRGGPAKASAAVTDTEVRMENFLKTLDDLRRTSKDSSKRASAVVNTFYYEARQRQVPIEQLAANPFHFRPRDPVSQPSVAATEPAAVRDESDLRELAKALKEVKALTLDSVMTGSNGSTAIISKNVLKVGQKISGWTVVQIAPKKVVLKWKNETYTMRIQ